MESILKSELREQAGSNSYNRFDYQAHWIVYHMLKEYERGSEFFVFCEYHDDMAKSGNVSNPSCAEFFQIKTSEKYKTWTLSRLTETTKKKNGEFKHSFLGFLFYNFLKFEKECTKCHFVSNIGMDRDIKTWQAIIEDELRLEKENNQMYTTIKSLIRVEFQELEEKHFDSVFDVFIQNTHIYHGDLSLENYEKVVAGEFFNMLGNTEIYTSSSKKILRDIIEDVRKKSKHKIDIPISFNRLKEEKGVSSEIFSKIREQINQTQSKKIYSDIEVFLGSQGMTLPQCKFIIRTLKVHHNRLLDISNTLYQDTMNELISTIDELILNNFDRIDDIDFFKRELKNLKGKRFNEDINDFLMEALLYERLLIE
ncbi:dsDNA nuclease domain-containing protein [Rossellomorea aquimaris]|uniref:dsDNA nuclease domain-containing protein n=1 Tax=Rossellomorea aquimaris TaxID=189382 RepID=UPI0037C52D85